jgi:hypothetical protein
VALGRKDTENLLPDFAAARGAHSRLLKSVAGALILSMRVDNLHWIG